jgi:hypothetical protein
MHTQQQRANEWGGEKMNKKIVVNNNTNSHTTNSVSQKPKAAITAAVGSSPTPAGIFSQNTFIFPHFPLHPHH